MTSRVRSVILAIILVTTICSLPLSSRAQRRPYRMTDQQVARIVPTAFYFQGQSAPTQMRNATAMRLGEDRHVIAGLVDTTGYAADVRAKYEGFLITDLPITINGEGLGIGAYGFGFSNDGKFSVMNIAGDQLLSVATTKDNALRRPRPLMMAESDSGIRLYSGKDYVVIAAK
ncbi:MAG: hypothetical protein WAL47_09130 [Pyrinomonadaceae bacterium]